MVGEKAADIIRGRALTAEIPEESFA